MKKGILTIVSGFSGVGKGTILKELLNKYKNYSLSVSATTRKARNGEEDGKAYFFKTKEEFENMISQDAFIEYANYAGNYYGTPKDYVMEKIQNGQDVILEIEMQGALKVKEKYPETVLIFVVAPTATSLKKRLESRATENNEQIKNRLKIAVKEVENIYKYDYIVVNDVLEDSATKIHNLIQAQKLSTIYNKNFIEKISTDIKREFLREEI